MKSYLIRTLAVIGVITMSLAVNSLAIARTDTDANHDKAKHTTHHRSHRTSHKSSHHTRSHQKTHTDKAKSTLSDVS